MIRNMEDILPEDFLDWLRDHYYAGVTNAEFGFEQHAADEDSLTGALGQALMLRGPTTVEIDGNSFRVDSHYYKFGGRGKGAPEREIGADGIFELSVLDAFGQVVRRKGLLFQAKKEWRGTNQDLVRQAERMVERSGSSIVVDYGPAGYTAFAAEDVMIARGNRRAIPRNRNVPLAKMLGDEFLRCRRGDIGLYWSPNSKQLKFDGRVVPEISPHHIMATSVRRLQ